MTMTTHAVPEVNCPGCRKPQNRSTVEAPRAGDLLVCAGCGAICEWTDPPGLVLCQSNVVLIRNPAALRRAQQLAAVVKKSLGGQS